MKLLRDRKRNCTTNATAYDTNLLKTVKVSSYTERTNEVLKVFALFLVIELFSSAANDLENDLNGACLAVISCNGKGNSLALLVNSEEPCAWRSRACRRWY